MLNKLKKTANVLTQKIYERSFIVSINKYWLSPFICLLSIFFTCFLCKMVSSADLHRIMIAPSFVVSVFVFNSMKSTMSEIQMKSTCTESS